MTSNPLEEAREYRSDRQQLDAVAHSIANLMVDSPANPRIKILVAKYRTLRTKIEHFEAQRSSP
jgi:hypothetical protein